MSHTCHAKRCRTNVPPRMLMCLMHWRMVPYALQKAVWAEYVPGQEIRKDPTAEYLEVAQAAIDAVAKQEEDSHGRHSPTRRRSPIPRKGNR